MEFGVQKVAAGALKAPLAVPKMAPEMALERALVRALVRESRTALLSLWALSFQPWLSFAGDGPLT